MSSFRTIGGPINIADVGVCSGRWRGMLDHRRELRGGGWMSSDRPARWQVAVDGPSMGLGGVGGDTEKRVVLASRVNTTSSTAIDVTSVVAKCGVPGAA